MATRYALLDGDSVRLANGTEESPYSTPLDGSHDQATFSARSGSSRRRILSAETVAPDVYFPIEIMSREYSGHLLLATELAARGRNAVMGHKGRVVDAMQRATRGGLLFYKHTWNRAWSDDRHAFVGQDPESGISLADYADFHASGRIDFRDSPTRGQFCFGPDDFEFLTHHSPEAADRIFPTGSPRISLWGRDGDIYYAKAASQIAARYGRFVLFASAAGGFPHENVLAGAGMTTAAWKEASAGHSFFGLARRAAEKLDVPVIIRPHPAESWTAWADLIAPIRNLYLEKVFDLSAWTRNAIAVVHPGESTAALEAVVAGCPAISTGSYPSDLMVPLSHVSRDPDHLIDLIRSAFSGTLPAIVTSEAAVVVRRKLYHPIEGAAQRIADVLDVIAPVAGQSGLRPATRWRSAQMSVVRSFRRTDSEDGEHLGRTMAPNYKRPPLSLARVRRDVESAAAVLGRSAVNVNQLGENCFVLSR